MSTLRRVVTFGEGLAVLRTAEVGSLAHLDVLRVGTGGAEGNVAVGLARLGVPVLWAGRIGADGLGQRVLRELRAEGVQTAAAVDHSAATGVIVKSSPTPGRTEVSYHRAGSAGSRLRWTDLEPIALGASDILHLTGITPALSESARDATLRAVAHARSVGALVSFDVNHRAGLWAAEEAAAVYRTIAAQSDLVFAGVDEARTLVPNAGGTDAGETDDDPAGLAAAIAALGPAEVVVKDGVAGAVAWTAEGARHRDAVRARVVDTVGAGDSFVAGYLAELAAGAGVEQRLETAVRVAARVCEHPGDWEGAPTRAELDRAPSIDPVQR